MWYAISFAAGCVLTFLVCKVWWKKEIAAGKNLLSQTIGGIQKQVNKL